MFGIAAERQVENTYRGDLSPLVYPLPWAAITGESMFENEAVCIASHTHIYNYRDLSRLVENGFKNEAGLIGLLYIKYGTKLFEMLAGIFSLCIVDKIKHRFILATDHFGISPLVYCAGKNRFMFASRIRDITALPDAGIGGIDSEALVDYINFSAIPTPKTIFRNIKKLPPGYFLTLTQGNLHPALTQYYDISYASEHGGEAYFLREIPQSVEQSVKRVLDYESVNGRTAGAFLSGGTDSSTVTGMMKKISGSVKTFSIGFDEADYNELDYARITARHFGAEHYEYLVTPHDVIKSLDSVLDAFDEPFGNASAVPTYYCALLARGHGVDTLLAGDGGDEIFGGNERYASDRIFSSYHTIPSFMRKAVLEPCISLMPSFVALADKGKRYIRRANLPQPDRFFSYNPVMALGRETIFSPELLSSINGYDPISWARELYHSVSATSELDRLLYIDMKFTITDNDLRKVSFMTEKAGIKVAYPLLDLRLVDLAATIPARLKVKGTTLRYVFKKSFKEFLPSEVIQKKKHGFGLPIGIWMRTNGAISSLVRETLLSSDCTIRPFFRKGFIEELFALHRETGAAFYGDILWMVFIFELWHKAVKRRPGKVNCS